MLRDTVEKVINAVLGLGFIILILGIGLWVFNISQQFRLPVEATLVIFGCVFLLFGALAAKVFSNIRR
jgi:hypothetical protein